jgi:hypothetical protein
MPEAPWLMLIHQIPPKPDYFRVKVRRRLQTLGAVAIKNSVYVLPNTEQAQEDFQWMLQEIKAEGGDAMTCEAHFVEGLTDQQIRESFRATREEGYQEIAEEARKLVKVASEKGFVTEDRGEIAGQIVRLKRRLAEAALIDFFDAPGRKEAESLLLQVEKAVRTRSSSPAKVAKAGTNDRSHEFRGRTWITRKGIHVDRMASAWLIRRFIDPDARFKFVTSRGYRPQPGELRFDMFDAEYTHEGDCCTLEVLLERFALQDAALRPIAEIVHDIDLKDSKFGRPETAGVSQLIAGIALNHNEDEQRLERGFALFDDLLECFRRKRNPKT